MNQPEHLNLNLMQAVLPYEASKLVLADNNPHKMMQVVMHKSPDTTLKHRIRLLHNAPPLPVMRLLYIEEPLNSAQKMFTAFVIGSLLGDGNAWELGALAHAACQFPVLVDVPCDTNMCAQKVPSQAVLLGKHARMCTMGFRPPQLFLDAWADCENMPFSHEEVRDAIENWDAPKLYSKTGRMSIPHGGRDGMFWVYFPEKAVCAP